VEKKEEDPCMPSHAHMHPQRYQIIVPHGTNHRSKLYIHPSFFGWSEVLVQPHPSLLELLVLCGKEWGDISLVGAGEG